MGKGVPLRAYVGLSLLFAAIGIWIVVAPTAVSFQARGGHWVSAGFNDVIVGGLLVLAGFGLLIAQLVAGMRGRIRAAAAERR